jgi:hypothetical protein
VTAEERLALRVPAEADRESYKGKGYSVEDLDEAIEEMDALTLKSFRQNACSDPVAVRVLHLDKLVKRDNGEKAATSSPPWKKKNELALFKKNASFEKTVQSAELTRNEKESEDEKSATLTPATGKQKKLTNHSLQKLDHPNSLPQKSGKIDQELYTKFKKDGLRRRLWDAVKQGHCTRCGSTEHLRSKCAQEARGWEIDFNKGAEFWTRTAGKLAITGKQARMQLRERKSAVLCLRIEDELVVLDTSP